MIRYELGDLLAIYRVAVEEYRFEVRLNWDRTKYFLLFNSALVSAATGLLSVPLPPWGSALVGLIFFAGSVTSLAGIQAIRTGHRYYRRALYKKTLVEKVLGLGTRLAGHEYPDATLALTTTPTQAGRDEILYNTAPWLERPLRRGSVVFLACMMLWVLLAINLGGFIVAVAPLWKEALKLIAC